MKMSTADVANRILFRALQQNSGLGADKVVSMHNQASCHEVLLGVGFSFTNSTNSGSRWGRMVRYTPRSLCPQRKRPRYLLGSRLEGLVNQSGLRCYNVKSCELKEEKHTHISTGSCLSFPFYLTV